MALRIEDYAIIGDMHTAAVVGADGSIDWLCLPDFDSPSCFARLVGTDSHGYWKIAPAGGPSAVLASRRRYREDSLVLETEFDTATGTVRISDFMPVGVSHPHVMRVVEGIAGTVDLALELTLRFDYGDAVPWVTSSPGLLRMTAGPDAVALWHRVHTVGKNLTTVADFTVSTGQRYPFTLVWHPSNEEPPAPLDTYYALEHTDAIWKEWAGRCTYEGPWRDQVVRSLLTLKALTVETTGGIVAAPTTSLPETLGGGRNWDYRYCWLRDAALTLESLMRGGYLDEALAWRDWLVRSVAGDPARLQIMYGPSGERRLVEWEADWLPGYESSTPVRIGNAASGQFQLDVYGEVLSALHAAAHADGVPNAAAWDLQIKLIEFLASAWIAPDDGIWEVRGPRRHFTHSKVMAWVAVDRAVRTLEQWPDLKGDLEGWRELRARIHADVCEHGFNRDLGAFTQYYGADTLDASVLMIPLVGFLPPDDPRVVSTVEAVEHRLLADGLVLRYETSDAGPVDGLSGREGAFLACSFWLVDCLHLIGRTADAEALFERLVGLSNALGLLAEEYDPVAGRLVGNFPQAFFHVSLVNSAFRLAGADPLTTVAAALGATPAGRRAARAASRRTARSRRSRTKGEGGRSARRRGP